MRFELDTRRVLIAVTWRHRRRASRSTITAVELRIGRWSWDRIRVTYDETAHLRAAAKRLGSPLDRLDLRRAPICGNLFCGGRTSPTTGLCNNICCGRSLP